MIFQHHRQQIWNTSQHPYQHNGADIIFSSPAMPSVSNVLQALEHITAVLYPNTEDAVANVAALPAAANTINDYRVVLDDGDGKQAGYRWEQREGDAAPLWYKIYDFDWSSDGILAAFLDITQDEYVHKMGRDDADEFGVALTGNLAGQHVYGGVTANTHLTLHANSGDGVGAQTGFVQTEDPLRPFPGVSIALGTTAARWTTVWSANLVAGTMTISAGSITDTSGAIDFGNENLGTTGSITSGTLTISSGSIIDSSGAISFGNEALTTTGRVTANDVQATGGVSAFFSGTTVGNLTLANGSITDSSGAISFANENLSTTGTFSSGNATVTRLDADNIRVDGNTISVLDAGGDLNLLANGAGVIDLGSAATSLNITATGFVNATLSMSAPIVDGGNLRLATNILSSQNVDGDITFSPNGTGDIIHDASVAPNADNTRAIGTTTLRYTSLFLSTGIGDGTTVITQATLQSFRDANVGVGVGDALFWTGTKWEASNPDTEIDHGELSGIGDDDHTQYTLLAGRATGQSIFGGVAASENLTLDSTAHATKGSVIFVSTLRPSADNAVDLGAVATRVRNLYIAGQGIGFRAENAANFAGLPAASASNPGRLAWTVAENNLYVDDGGTWKPITTDAFYLEDATGWTGAVATVSYDVSSTCDNAKKMIWALKKNASNYETLVGAVITHTSNTNVTVTFGVDLASGTYTLVGR